MEPKIEEIEDEPVIESQEFTFETTEDIKSALNKYNKVRDFSENTAVVVLNYSIGVIN